jgi:hypothetical protein
MLFTPHGHHPLSPREMDRSPAPAGFASPLRSLRLTTAATDIVAGPPPVAVCSKPNALVTDPTPGGFNRGRIFQPLEGVVVRTPININPGCNRVTASRARLPRAAVAFRVMEPTQGQAARVMITAMSRVGTELVGMGIIATPLLAALGLGPPLAFAAYRPRRRCDGMSERCSRLALGLDCHVGGINLSDTVTRVDMPDHVDGNAPMRPVGLLPSDPAVPAMVLQAGREIRQAPE